MLGRVGKLEFAIVSAVALFGLIVIVVAMLPSELERGNASYNRGEYEEAFEKWHPLAMKGDLVAQTGIGHLYESGKGVEKNAAEAVNWYRKAAQQRHAPAQNSLGLAYYHGTGVKRDYGEALNWYQRGAELGHAEAQNNLGDMIRAGLGVPVDTVMALMWFELAVAGGSESATRNRDETIASMSPADVAKAKQMAREWQAKHDG